MGWWGFAKREQFELGFPALGPLLGQSWGSLGPSRGPLGPSWALFRPSWNPLGGLLGRLGSLLGRRGRCENPRSEYAKNVRFPKGMGRFLPRGGPLGGLLGRLGGVLSRPEAVFGASRADLRQSRSVRCAIGAAPKARGRPRRPPRRGQGFSGPPGAARSGPGGAGSMPLRGVPHALTRLL